MEVKPCVLCAPTNNTYREWTFCLSIQAIAGTTPTITLIKGSLLFPIPKVKISHRVAVQQYYEWFPVTLGLYYLQTPTDVAKLVKR